MIKIGQKLRAAVLEKDRDKIKELLEDGADPNAVIPGEDFAAIHLGAGTTKSITKLLLKNGADPNLQTNDGSTPLHIAASWGKSDILKILLKYGGDERIRDSENLTAGEVAQNHEFWDCSNILQKCHKKRLRNQLETGKQKHSLHQSVASPAQVHVNVHQGHIDMFTELTDRKSQGWNVDNPHGHGSRNRTLPLMSAIFSLPPRVDSLYSKGSDSVTSSEASTVSSSLKRQMYLTAGSTEHNWENPDTEDFFSADPSLDRAVHERSVKAKILKERAEIGSTKSDNKNEVWMENKNEHSATESKTGICPDPTNQNQRADEIKNCICIEQCSSAETEDNGHCVQHLKYLIGPESVSKYIVKNDNTDSDASTINFDTVSTVISTVPNDAYPQSRTEQRLGTEHFKSDKCNCHILEMKDENEFINLEQFDNQISHKTQLNTENLKSDKCECYIQESKDQNEIFHPEEFDDQVIDEQQPLAEHLHSNKQADVHSLKKTESQCQELSYDHCFCSKRLQIKIDLRFSPLKSDCREIRDSNSSKGSMTSRSQNSVEHDNVCQRCSDRVTENKTYVTNTKSNVQPNSIHRETTNNGTCKLTAEVSGGSLLNVQTRSHCDLQCADLAKGATKQNGKGKNRI